MLSIFDPFRNLNFSSILIQLLLSVLFGGIIGLERSAKNRPAGFRTHILVCLGAAVATQASLYIYLGLHLPDDITRISGQVITGLGFIGTGTIIVTNKKTIKGLTTAAGLWVTGIIGIAVGAGFYEGAILTTILVLITETYIHNIGMNIKKDPQFVLEILYNDKESLGLVMRYCKDHRTLIKQLQVQNHSDSSANYCATLILQTTTDKDMLIDNIRMMPGIISVAEI